MSDLNPYEESLAVDLAKTEAAIKAMTEQLEAARHDADEAEAYAWQLEQRLSKAMEALQVAEEYIAELEWFYGGGTLATGDKYYAVLAELTSKGNT